MSRLAIYRWVLLLAVLAVFGRIAFHEFTWWDDPHTLHQNPRMNPPSAASVAWYWAHAEKSIYIPVTQTVWSALASVAYLDSPDEQGIRLNPWIFHAASVVAHALAALAVFALLRQLIPADLPALAGALLFALHPVQVESVAWASGLKDVLWGLFGFVALYAYVRAAAPISPKQPKRGEAASADSARLYPVALGAGALSMLSKPTGMVVPAMAGVLDLFLLRRPVGRVLRTLWPWLLLAAVCAILAKLAQPAPFAPEVPLWARPLIAADALAFYLYKLIFPATLAMNYGRRPDVVLAHGWLYYTWIVPAILAAAIFWAGRRYPILWASGLLFVIGLAPVLGLVPFEFQTYSTTADHYLYGAMVGPALAFAWLLYRFPRRGLQVAAALLLAVLAVRSFLQAGHWRSDLALWQHTARVTPASYAAQKMLGDSLAAAGQLADAATHYQRAIQLRPELPDAWQALFALRLRGNELDAARELLDRWESSRAAAAANALARERLGDAFAAQKRVADAIAQYEAALRQDPRRAGLREKLNALRSAPAPATGPAPRL